MFQIADTPEKIEKAVEYLKKNEIATLDYTIYFYIEQSEKLIAVAGWNHNFGGTIEPFKADSIELAKELFSFMLGGMVLKGYRIINIWTSDERIIDIITKRYGFVKYLDNLYTYKL